MYNHIFGINNRLEGMYIAKNITLKELECRCGCATPPQVLARLVTLATFLQRIRDFYNKPLIINSGYRCNYHNVRVGGASRSYHLDGIAADIWIVGVSSKELFRQVHAAMKKGYIPAGGLKDYGTFVHYDYRGYITKF